MRVTETTLSGVLVFTPSPVRDARGFFSRTFDAAAFRGAGLDPDGFAQDSLSRSRQGVVRGLHLRSGAGEGKLVRCSHGRIWDVVVDLRRGSPTFGRWESFDLDGDTQRSVYIPAGCAHGFQSLSDPADTAYRIDREHDPSEDVSIAHDDADLGIPWPMDPVLMSERDKTAPGLRDLGLFP